MDVIWIILIGLLGGVSGGMLGIGGSTVMIPCLTMLFGPRHQHLHQAVGMIVTFFVVSTAVIEHRRVGAVIGPCVGRMLPGALIGVLAGVWISERPAFQGQGQVYLAAVFGLLLAYIVAADLRLLLRRTQPAPVTAEQPGQANENRSYWIGAIAGLLGGLTGVGGGFIAVPLQRRWLGMPLRSAIANSAAMIVGLSLVGAIYKNAALFQAHGYGPAEPFKLAATLTPSAIIGSLIGSRLAHRLPVRAIHATFTAFLALAAIRLILYPFT